jgi:hypothetical protein
VAKGARVTRRFTCADCGKIANRPLKRQFNPNALKVGSGFIKCLFKAYRTSDIRLPIKPGPIFRIGLVQEVQRKQAGTG